MFCLANLFVFNRTIIVIITDLGMPNIMNWDFPKRWDHRFFDKKSPGSRTLKHLNFICLDSLPTLRRTLRKLPCLAKFKSTRTRSFATPSLSCRESIYLNIYSTCSTKSNSGFWSVASGAGTTSFLEAISSCPQVLLPPTIRDKEKVLHIQDASYHEVEPWMEDVSF